eukprot:TRINITY_DN6441_c2_g2_i6.p2 TRINITY_DN6441_c2_g2~~TRINITY_DN6441_c2_g2_i6.p2  ORF type:complete len:232 (+),score=58.08 TRINITY_DN6441_c2_g2_i6:63-758(+)
MSQVVRGGLWNGFKRTQSMAGVRCWLQAHDASHVRYEEFDRKCEELGVEKEAREGFLRALEQSGSVVYADGLVGLQAEQVFDDLKARVGVRDDHFHDQEIDLLEKELAVLDAEKEKIDKKIEVWRRKVWSRTAAYCGAQMWLFSRLTFVDFDWDIMEPISWFFVQGNAVLFFAFLWKYHKEHSLTVYDETVLSKVAVHMYKSHCFDVSRWSEVKARLEVIKAERAQPLKIL